MKPYWKVFGTKVRVRSLLSEGGREWGDLPSSQDICWSRQTGVCFAGNACRRASTHGRRLTDSEAGKAAEALKAGVAKVVAAGSLPPAGPFAGSKRKVGQ